MGVDPHQQSGSRRPHPPPLTPARLTSSAATATAPPNWCRCPTRSHPSGAAADSRGAGPMRGSPTAATTTTSTATRSGPEAHSARTASPRHSAGKRVEWAQQGPTSTGRSSCPRPDAPCPPPRPGQPSRRLWRRSTSHRPTSPRPVHQHCRCGYCRRPARPGRASRSRGGRSSRTQGRTPALASSAAAAGRLRRSAGGHRRARSTSIPISWPSTASTVEVSTASVVTSVTGKSSSPGQPPGYLARHVIRRQLDTPRHITTGQRLVDTALGLKAFGALT